MDKQRVIVYVDGFNFYYGLRSEPRWKRYYWLDVVSFFDKFMKDNQELIAVKYFSARPYDNDKKRNQNAFFQANKENPRFRLILGKYLRKTFVCHNCHRQIHTYEEKESDVRIATQIVADAYQDNCDVAIVVSADSDMIPAMELAIEAGKKVYAYFPPNQHSNNIRVLCGNVIDLARYESRFRQSLLPDVVHLRASDYDLNIPEKWKLLQTPAGLGQPTENEEMPL